MRARPSPGFTLIELLTVCAIVGVTSAFALPALDDWQRNAWQGTRVTAFVVSAQLARGEALRRGHSVTLCPSKDGESCSSDFAQGWIVFDDPGGDRERDTDDTLLDRYQAPAAGPVLTGVLRLTWRGGGRRSTNGTLTFCDGRSIARSRAVVVSYTGRPRVEKTLPGGKKLPC